MRPGWWLCDVIRNLNSCYLSTPLILLLLPRQHSGKKSTCQCRRCKRHGFDPWVGKVLWSRKWQPIQVFLPGRFYGQRSLEAPVHGVTKSQTQWNACARVHAHTHTHTPYYHELVTIVMIKLFINLQHSVCICKKKGKVMEHVSWRPFSNFPLKASDSSYSSLA